MMKNSTLSLIATTLLLVLGACTTLCAETVWLSYATNTEPTGLRGLAEKAFLEEIERLGKGTIRIQPHWEQSFLKDKELLEGIRDGSVDMGHVNINYYPSRLVINGAITLFQRGPSRYQDRMWVYDTLYGEIPELCEEFSRYNQKVIYTYSVLPLAGAFTQPIHTLADFKNRRVRASSRWLLRILEGAGAVPVALPWADTYMALKTNALEGIYTNLDAIHRISLDTVAPHLLIFREFWNPVPFHVTINLDTWRRLSPAVKEIIQAASKNSKEAFATRYHSMLDEIVADETGQGCDVRFAKKEDVLLWMKLPEVELVKKLWVKDVSNQLTTAEAEAILSQMERIIGRGIHRDREI